MGKLGTAINDAERRKPGSGKSNYFLTVVGCRSYRIPYAETRISSWFKETIWVPGIALAFFAWAAIYANLTISWLIMILIGVVNITRFITILALPTEMVPAENIGAASGLIFCLGYLGATVGPIISGHILDLTGSLKLSLYSLVALSLIAAGIALFVPETSPNDKSY
jgi:CP family cyanate transporter-like MFS transporter